MINIWRVIYWISFAACWFVLPFLQEYHSSNDKNTIDKIKYSLKSNTIFYVIYFVVVLLILAFLFIENTELDLKLIITGMTNS